MRAAAVMRDNLRDGSSLREQGIQHLNRGSVVARVAGRGDGVQPGSMRAQPRHVPRYGRTPVEGVAITYRLHIGHATQAVPGAGPTGVDQLDAGRQRFKVVSIKTTLTPVRPLSYSGRHVRIVR